ncbi:MAG: ABC transporter permease [Chloroflexota bacterium]|nr:ABC transporter permease [Chloroflexota bacterium]MDE2969160.1 ABC transporter permease [Chloroflexota bacterium]
MAHVERGPIADIDDAAQTDEQRRSRGPWARAALELLRRPKAVFGIAVIVLLYGGGVLAPVLAPYGFDDQDLLAAREGPSADHLLGTDFVGRDVLSRVIYSLRTNLIVTATAVATGSLALGITLGLMAGYFGKRVDTAVMRMGEVFLAFPGLLLVILLAATVRPRVLEWVRGLEDATGIYGLAQWGVADYLVVFGALAVFSWVGVARLVRGQVIQLKAMPFVEASKTTGATAPRLILKHLLPNALPPVIVVVTMGMGAIAGAEVVLSWLGIGIQHPVPSLGSMIREGQDVSILRNQPHLILPPVIVVGLLVFAWNLLGDALNDVLNPRAR